MITCKTKQVKPDQEAVEEAADLKLDSKTAITDHAEVASAAFEMDMSERKITKIDTMFSPATKSTTLNPKPTKTARRDKLSTVVGEVKEAPGAEVAEEAEAAKVFETGKAQGQYAKMLEIKSSPKTKR